MLDEVKDDLRASFRPLPGLAPLVVRLAAYVVDLVIVVPLIFIAVFTTVIAFGGALATVIAADSAKKHALDWLGPAAASAAAGVVAVIAWIALTVLTLYQWYLLATQGQTIGKRMCGIRIVTLDGKPAGFVRALLLRSLIFISLVSMVAGAASAVLPILGSVIVWLDYVFAFAPDRRCIHDHFAGTQVRWVKVFEVRKARVAGAFAAVAALGVGGLVLVERAELAPLIERGRGVIASAPVAPAPVTPVAVVAPPVAPPVAEEAAAVAEPPPAPRTEVAIYTFVDGEGVTHAVDNLDAVPPRFRKTATVIRP